MSEQTPNFGLSEDWLKLIGAFVVQWSVFEWVLTSHIRIFLHQAEAESLRPKHLAVSFKDRLSLYRKLTSVFYTDDALKSAELGTRIAEAVKDDREWLVHGTAMQEREGDLTVFRSYEMKTNEAKEMDQRFTRDRVLAATRAIEEGRLCLIRAFASISGKLVPPGYPGI